MKRIDISKEERKIRKVLEKRRLSEREQNGETNYVEIKERNSVYRGFQKDGKKHGLGEENYTNSHTQIGKWNNDRFVYGVQRTGSGNSYSGQWDYLDRHGYGRQEWIDGSSYEGEWENDSRHGIGTMVFPDGGKLTGIWSVDLPLNGTWILPGGGMVEIKDYKIDGVELQFLPIHTQYYEMNYDYYTGEYDEIAFISGFQFGRRDLGYHTLPTFSDYVLFGSCESQPNIHTPSRFEKKGSIEPTIIFPEEVGSFKVSWVKERVKHQYPSEVGILDQLDLCTKEYTVRDRDSLYTMYFLNQLEVSEIEKSNVSRESLFLPPTEKGEEGLVICSLPDSRIYKIIALEYWGSDYFSKGLPDEV